MMCPSTTIQNLSKSLLLAEGTYAVTGLYYNSVHDLLGGKFAIEVRIDSEDLKKFEHYSFTSSQFNEELIIKKTAKELTKPDNLVVPEYWYKL